MRGRGSDWPARRPRSAGDRPTSFCTTPTCEKKKSYIERYIQHIGIALREILGLPEKVEAELVTTLREVLERSRTTK